MKNLSLIIMAFAALLFNSCRPDAQPTYEGANLLHFNYVTEKSESVLVGTNSKDVTINYGTMKVVNGSHQVKLIFDAAKSTAVQGVDFQIIKGTDDIVAGESIGDFVVRILEANATPVPKVAYFTLQSTTLQGATYNQTFKLSMSLNCPISLFVGTFSGNGWWNGPGTYDIVEDTVNPNTLLVKDFLEPGRDLILKYDGDGNVTLDAQDTGYYVAQYSGNIWVRVSQATSANHGPSVLDKCARTMNLKLNYYIPGVGSYGNQNETFVGL